MVLKPTHARYIRVVYKSNPFLVKINMALKPTHAIHSCNWYVYMKSKRVYRKCI